MSQQQPLASHIYISIEGTEAEPAVMQKVLGVVVDQHAHLPDMFTLCLQDADLKMLDEGPFDLAKTVEIAAENAEGKKTTLIKGEITALEPEFNEGMDAELVVRGYDKSHRLYRESKSKAHLNKKDSDLAEEIARAVNLRAEVDATDTVYDHIYQHNQSDLAFLMQRAWRIGYECFVSDDKLYFRKPPSDAATVTLTWGQDLLSFHPRMNVAEQVNEVIVKGWDVDKQSPIVGTAQQGQLYPKVKESKDGAAWAQDCGGGKLVIVDQPIVSQAEANVLAAARLNEISGVFIEAEGVAFRRPDVKAGQKVELKALGKRLSGTYLVTNATHAYAADGLTTTFTVRGTRTGLLAEQLGYRMPLTHWTGVVPAIVTNTDDPKGWGRVKVKFPWMADDAESDWARVAGVGAGPEAGLCVMPEVNDEVLVTFAYGDFSQPYVLGGTWNGQYAIPPECAGASSGEKPLVRTWRSRTGHHITMYDNADNKVELITAGEHQVVLDDKQSNITISSKEGHQIVLDDKNKSITITSKGGISLKLDDQGKKVTIQGSTDVDIQASGNLSLKANGEMNLQANGQVNIKGAMVNLN
ncbi:MAG: VgrG-related protein [Anaerolineae bacterium]|nr:VgrG-related protein [Anaerolineae bacterium]